MSRTSPPPTGSPNEAGKNAAMRRSGEEPR
jgi:hypothetical protein